MIFISKGWKAYGWCEDLIGVGAIKMAAKDLSVLSLVMRFLRAISQNDIQRIFWNASVLSGIAGMSTITE